MQDIKFSVIVSIFNIEKYLKRCLDSIINQTYKNLEIILIDDGSTDSSSLICDEYSKMDCRIKVIHKKNEGLGFARNTGLSIASGDYISFVDGDDFIDKKLFSICDKILINKRYDIIDFDFVEVDNNDIILHENVRKNNYAVCGNEIKSKLLSNMIYNYKNKLCLYDCSWNKIFKTNFLKQINFKFVSERKYISEDYYSNLVIYNSVESVYVIKDRLYYYCHNDNSLTRKINFDRFDKNKFLYQESIKLCDKYSFDNTIKIKIFIQIVGNIMGHMKQIMLYDKLSKCQKQKIIKQIVCDEFFSDGYTKTRKLKLSLKTNLFLFLCQYHFYSIIYFILKILLN